MIKICKKIQIEKIDTNSCDKKCNKVINQVVRAIVLQNCSIILGKVTKEMRS